MTKESRSEKKNTEEPGDSEPLEEAAEESVDAVDTLEEEEVGEAEVEKEVDLPSQKEIDEEIVEERLYTIPLGKAWLAPSNKRAPRAVKLIKAFIKRHMKLESSETETGDEEEPKRLVISNEVNERVWRRSIGKPPRRIRVRAAKDKEGDVTVYLAEGD